MQYPCRIFANVTADTQRRLQEMADARQESIGETARYALTQWVNNEVRKQVRRRQREIDLAEARADFLTRMERVEVQVME